jgi:hypothetical protein
METAVGSEKQRRQRGNSVVEFSFLMPFYVFLFVGVYVLGVACYALVSLQSAARVAAVHCSLHSCTTGTTDSTVCGFALDALRGLPNVGSGVTTCSSPVSINVASVPGPDNSGAVSVTVAYTLPSFANIPGILNSNYTARRTVQMRVAS